MAKILIVDDNPELRFALKEILSAAGHRCLEAQDGIEAQGLVFSSNPDLLISDFQMPRMDGLGLLSWVKKESPRPIILMTAFGNILETHKAFELGADDFFTKPFRNEDILSAVENIMEPIKREREQQSRDENFCRIPIEEFVSADGIKINVHIRLAPNKYIRVAHQGDQIPVDRVDNYRAKGVTFLYAFKNDFYKLVGFNLQINRGLQKSEEFSVEKKTQFLRYTSETVLENLLVNGVEKVSYDQARECVEAYLSLISESDSLFSLLNILNEHSDWLYAHSMGVSLYSVMIAKKMGWSSSMVLFKIGMAGIFHDIGSKEIERSILEKERPTMTQPERQSYETHPTRSKQILEDIKEVPGEIVQIVLDHHENSMGLGYPRKVPRERIHPLSKVIAVADTFCYYAVKNPHYKSFSALQAVEFIEQNHIYELDRTAVAALRKLTDVTTAV